MRIVFATGNAHKVREAARSLGEGVELVPLSEAGFDADIPETEDTIQGNAVLKARTVHEALGQPVIAEDTGLEVDALDGAPGVYTARYAGTGRAEDNIAKLLDALRGETDRRAQFRTVLCHITADGTVHTHTGLVRGTITTEPMGEGGFGYDPVFRPAGYDATFAELDPAIKALISHRALAVGAWARALRASR